MSLKGVAKETLKILDAGGFGAPSGEWVSLQPALEQAVASTRLYTPMELEGLLAAPQPDTERSLHAPRIEVNGDTTQITRGGETSGPISP